MKVKHFLCFALGWLATTTFAQESKPSAAPQVQTFALNPNAAGAAANSVNLFTGDVALPLSLISLPGHNGLDASVSISYSSNVQNQVNVWNLEASSGMLGLGWNMEIPKIVADHKQTGLREDDDYYLIEGGSSNHLIRTTSGSDAGGSFYAYETKNYQFWKIKYYYDISEVYNSTSYGSGPNKWEITREDGTKYVYGDKNSGRNTIQWLVRWDNWIGNSAQTTNQSQMAYVWNLSEINNRWSEKVTFEYTNVDQFVGSASGKKHTEASYIKQITDVWGRKIVFNYKDKNSFVYNGQSSQFWMEPHTESNTEPNAPDAYQEFYEKNYLDYIDVFREDNSKLLTVQFGYTALDAGTNTAKMLLSSIVQKNSAGQALPGMQFTYNLSGVTKGFLSKITYPSGGTTSYTYGTNTLGHSNRQLTINAPTADGNGPYGYAEPKLWFGEDYVVVMWRALGAGSDGTKHLAGAQNVKLYVYQWVGEWKGQFLQSLRATAYVELGAINALYSFSYLNVQVVTQKNFFAVLGQGSGNNYNLFIQYKDESTRGSWLQYNPGTLDMGDGVPTLFSGENFVGVGTKQDGLIGSTYFTTRLYTSQGNTWKADILNQTCGDYYYTATNNYFISQNRAVCGGSTQGQPEFNFHFLSEDKKWATKSNKLSTYASSSPSYWTASNSFALAMAGDNPEYIYRWDLSYTNFTRDNVLGTLNDYSNVFLINNTSMGIYYKGPQLADQATAKMARFNGVGWDVTPSVNAGSRIPIGFGDDYFVWDIYGGSNANYNAYLKVYNPNIPASPWQSNLSYTVPKGPISNVVKAGNNVMQLGYNVYSRSANGSWSSTLTVSPNGYNYISGANMGYAAYSNYLLYNTDNGGGYRVPYIQFLRNGAVYGSPILIKTGVSSYKVYNGGGSWQNETDLVGPGTVVVTANTNDYANSSSLLLTRVTGNDAQLGSQTDYPVTLITVNDGTQDRYTTIDYNFNTAAIDPSGSIGQYNEVTMIPGSAVATSKPFGYTKTYFYNGLTAAELGVSYMPVDLRWTGVPYATRAYDSNNTLVASSNTTFTNYTRDILNDASTKVEVGYYARPTQTSSMADGITTTTSQSYDANTGMVTLAQSNDYDSKGNNKTFIRYKYYWEQYDPSRASNILSPVIQTKTSIFTANAGAEVVVGVSATTWKSWGGVMAPHKSYQWRRTGTADFNFTSWSNTGEPTADWIKSSQIDVVDSKGNALQMTTR